MQRSNFITDEVTSDSDASAPMPPDITRLEIRLQIKRDIDTKEVQTSPTYSYQWMADQVGHMALGMLVVLVFWSAGEVWNVVWLPFLGLVLVVIGATCWERYTYWQACAKIERLFNATRDREDLRQNALIATHYMVLGGVIALLALLLNKSIALWALLLNTLFPSLLVVASPVTKFIVLAIPTIIVAIDLAFLIIRPACYWLRQKMRFQQIGLPFLFRLPEFRLDEFDSANAKKIDWFIKDSGDGPGKHIAIIGSLNSGKTTLAVGIATEGSFNGKRARYLTLDKLQQLAVLPREPPAPRNTKLWPWKTSQLLIIDDVTAGIPGSTAEHPEQLRKELEDLGSAAREAIRRRNTVWCLGADISQFRQWTDVLMSGCGIAESDLLIVTLEKRPEHSADRVVGCVKHSW